MQLEKSAGEFRGKVEGKEKGSLQLQSEILLERVVKKLGLDKRPEYLAQSETSAHRLAEKIGLEHILSILPKPQYAALVRQVFNLPPPDLNTPHARALAVAASNLKIKAAAQSSLLELYYTAPDRKTPAEFLNALAEEYIAHTMEARWAGTERTAAWLNSRLQDMRRSLDESERKLQSYARDSGMLYTSDQESVAQERLRQLQAELSRAQAERTSLQSKYERVRSSAPEELPQVLDHPLLRDYSTRLADLEKEHSQLTTTMKPEHQQVQAVASQIKTLKGSIRVEVSNVLGRIRNEYEAANRREGLLTNAYEQQFAAVSAEAGRSVPYNILKREVESKRQFYQDMLQKVNSAGVATAIRASNIRVIKPAQEPMLPHRPNLLLNLSIGIGGGLLLGIAACFLKEAVDRRHRRLRRPGDAARYLQVPEFGVIPKINGAPDTRKRWFTGRKSLDLELRLRTDQGLAHPKIWNQQTPMLNDSFQAALDSLLFADPGLQRPRVVGVVSALPLEGKTTITACLGLALANISKRVLLIDADLRKPTLHCLFKVENGNGLSGLLQADASSAQLIQQAIVPTSVPGVDLLPAGASAENVAGLFASNRLGEILSHLRESYDTILVDTPPVLMFPEARMLGRQSDGVVLVVRSNQNPLDVHRQATDMLHRSGNALLGTILNDCSEPVPEHAARYYREYAGL